MSHWYLKDVYANCSVSRPIEIKINWFRCSTSICHKYKSIDAPSINGDRYLLSFSHILTLTITNLLHDEERTQLFTLFSVRCHVLSLVTQMCSSKYSFTFTALIFQWSNGLSHSSTDTALSYGNRPWPSRTRPPTSARIFQVHSIEHLSLHTVVCNVLLASLSQINVNLNMISPEVDARSTHKNQLAV